MSQWLESTSNSNKLKQSYFRDFVDVSGEVLIRNNHSLKLFDSLVPTRTQFSINSKGFRVFDDNDQTYHDISHANLRHIKDLTTNVQAQLDNINRKTIHFAANNANNDSTLIELDAVNNKVIVQSSLDVSFDIIGRSDLSINRNICIGGDASFNGRVDICGNFYAQYPENSIPANAIIGDVEGGGSIDPNSDLSLNQKLSVGGDVSFNSRVDICGNLYANYPNDSIPLSAVSSLLTNLNNKANIESPNFTGIPTAITADNGTNTTQLATTAFVQNRISEIIGAAPETLDTLNELASALGDDANFSTTITTLIGDNSQNLATEVSRATTAEGVLTTLINDVSDNLATEVSRATTAESSLTTLVSDVSDNLATEVSRATTAESSLTTLVSDVSDNLATEVSRATTAESGLTTTISDVSGNLATEVSRATTVESSLTTSISDISDTLVTKAPLANPTFTGILNANYMNITNDASFNSRVDICGNLYAQYPDNTIPASAIIGGVGGGGGIDPDTDVSLNQKLAVGGDVSLNSNVNISESLTVGTLQVPEFSSVTINNGAQWTLVGSDLVGSYSGERFGSDNIDLNADGTILVAGGHKYQGSVGRVVVFKYNGVSWIQRGQTIYGNAAGEYWGVWNSINAAGNIIAIGSHAASGSRGRVDMYQYNEITSTWDQLGQSIIGGSGDGLSGYGISLSQDGYTVVIGAISLNQGFVYRYTNSTWQQLGNTIAGVGGDNLGSSVDINFDGTIVALGTSTASIKIFTLVNSTWNLLGDSISTGGSSFNRLALSYDGNTVVAGDNGSSKVRVYRYANSVWTQIGQEISKSGNFGYSVKINYDGSIMTAAAYGISQAFIYQYDGSSWVQIAQTITAKSSGDRTGDSIALSRDGTIMAVGSSYYNNTGLVRVYEIAHTGGYSSSSSASSNNALTVYWSTNFYGDISFNGTINGLTADDVGLENVDNTSDANKPISTATQSALDLKSNINSPTFTGIPAAPTAGAGTNTTQLATTAFVNTAVSSKANLASPVLTGTPTAPTANSGTNTTQLATTAFVSTAITNLVSGAPGALDTLNELAAALGDDANFSTTVTNTLASKAPLANPTFTGQVDICGNLYAQYPNSSIPPSAIIGGVGGVSDNLSISNLNVSGNVGIGTSNPEKPLHVIGDSKIGSLNLTTITSQSGIVYDASWVQVGNTVQGVSMTEDPGAPYIGYTTSLNADGTIMAHGSNTGYVNVYKYRYITQAEWDTSPSDDRNISVVKYQDTVFDPNKKYWIQMGNSIRDTIGKADHYSSVALNETGNIIVIAGWWDDTYATNAGIGKVFTYNSNTDSWTKLGQDVYGVTNEYLGTCVDINADGTIVAYGTYYAYSFQGKIQVFQYNSGTNQWVQLGQTFTGGQFGVTLSLSSDGYTLACGTAAYMNALVYKYSLDTQTFQQVGGSIPYEVNGDRNGYAVSLTQDGSIVAVGSQWSDSTNATVSLNRAGQVRVFEYRLVTADEWAETATPNRSGVVIKNGDATLNVTKKYWVQLGNDILGINPDHRLGSQVFIRKTTEHGIILAAGEAARVYTFQYRSITEDEWNAPTINNNNMGVIKGNDTVYNSEKSYWIQIGGDIVRPSDAIGAFGSNKFGFNSSGTTIVTSAPNSDNGFGRVFVYNLPYRALNFQNDSVIDTLDNNSRRNLVLNNTLSIDASNNTTFTGRVDICGNLYAQYPNSSIPASAIIGGVGVDANSDVSFNQNISIGGDASFNQNISIGGDASFNQNISIGGDASFNGRVDVCGNFYAQYPDNSIPESAILRDAASGGNTVSDPVEFIDDFAIITGAGQEVTLDANNFALIKPLPYGQVGSHDITFENNFAIIQDGVEPYIHPRLSVTKYLSVSNLASFTGIVTFDNNVYVNTPNLYDSSQLVATTAYVKGQNYATPSTLFRQF